MIEYETLRKFFGESRLVDLAIAQYYIHGRISTSAPTEWDWDEIVCKFHVPSKTQLFISVGCL